MKNQIQFIAIVGAMVLLASCSDDQPAGRIEITPPAADLTFDEVFVKDREIHLQMPENVVLGQIGYVLVDAKGNLIVVDTIQETVFQTDAKGHYLRQIGARGGAEGEYFNAMKPRLAPNGDLYLYSFGGDTKYLFFSSDSYKFKREVPDPNPQFIDHIVLTEGGHIYGSQVDVIDAGPAGVREDGQYALFRFDDNLNKVASLYPVEDKRTGRALNRYHNTVLTPKRGGGFYFIYPTIYEIHQYSEQGELEQTWFSDYKSKHRDRIKPLPDGLDPVDWTPKHNEWFAEHIVRSRLYEFGPDLLVLSQFRRVVSGKAEFYLNLFYKDGHSVADGIRLPADHRMLTIDGTELYFAVEGAFDEVTGETSDPYIAVYRLNDREGAGKRAFGRSPGSQ